MRRNSRAMLFLLEANQSVHWTIESNFLQPHRCSKMMVSSWQWETHLQRLLYCTKKVYLSAVVNCPTVYLVDLKPCKLNHQEVNSDEELVLNLHFYNGNIQISKRTRSEAFHGTVYLVCLLPGSTLYRILTDLSFLFAGLLLYMHSFFLYPYMSNTLFVHFVCSGQTPPCFSQW